MSDSLPPRPPPEPALEPPLEPPPDFTLLLVHGIGQPKAGSVVDQVGNALLEWFTARLPAGASVEVERALLRPAVRGGGGPAEVTLLVREPGGTPERRLRLVESLWADEFDPPGFLEVGRWILGPGAWLLFRHVMNAPRRLLHRWRPELGGPSDFWLAVWSFFGVFVFFVLVLPLQLIGIVLAALRLLPIPYLRAQFEWIGLVVSDVLGDSYLFARNAVVRRALADRVRRDLDALPQDGSRVAILAHSQGAAVAFDMLKQHPHPPPLVTYGSGIRKLHELVGETSELGVPGVFRWLWWIALLWAAAMVGAGSNLASVRSGDFRPSQWAGMSFFFLGVLVYVAIRSTIIAVSRDHEIDESLSAPIGDLLRKQPAWLDACATRDPVPARPLIARGEVTSRADGGWWRSTRTVPSGKVDSLRTLDTLEPVNDMRMSTDHTSYWDNPDGFIDPLMQWLRRELAQGWLPERAALPAPWYRRSVRTWLRHGATLVLQIEVLVLWWRASGIAAQWLPSAPDAGEVAASWLPDVMAAARPLLQSAVLFAYGTGVAALLLVMHLLALAAYDRLLLEPNWRVLDRRLALYGGARPFRLFWRLLVFLLLFGVAAVALAVAIDLRSYAQLVQVPVEMLLDLHRFVFIRTSP